MELTALLGLPSHFGDKPLKFQVLCPQTNAQKKKQKNRDIKRARNRKFILPTLYIVVRSHTRGSHLKTDLLVKDACVPHVPDTHFSWIDLCLESFTALIT